MHHTRGYSHPNRKHSPVIDQDKKALINKKNLDKVLSSVPRLWYVALSNSSRAHKPSLQMLKEEVKSKHSMQTLQPLPLESETIEKEDPDVDRPISARLGKRKRSRPITSNRVSKDISIFSYFFISLMLSYRFIWISDRTSLNSTINRRLSSCQGHRIHPLLSTQVASTETRRSLAEPTAESASFARVLFLLRSKIAPVRLNLSRRLESPVTPL